MEEKHPAMTLCSSEENFKLVNQRFALEGEPASGRSTLFVAQILQKLVEEKEGSLEGPRKAIAMDRKALCLG